jgi:hypothetical protein
MGSENENAKKNVVEGDRYGNELLVQEEDDESERGMEVENESGNGNGNGQGGVRVGLLGWRRRVGRRPCAEKHDVPRQAQHIQEQLCLCFDRLWWWWWLVREKRKREGAHIFQREGGQF